MNDRSVLFGDGAYETMRTYSGRFFRFPEHLRRLRDTLRGIGLTLPCSDDEIVAGTSALVEANGIPEARLRLTVTGGRHTGAIRLRRDERPNLILTAELLMPPAAEVYTEGVEVSGPLPHPLRFASPPHQDHHASCTSWPRRRRWSRAPTRRCSWMRRAPPRGNRHQRVLRGGRGSATAGAGRAAAGGGDPGRGPRSGPGRGVTVEERTVRATELERASEALLTSTTTELLPMTAVSGRPVGSGRPGPVREKLHRLYRALVSRETGVALSPLPES